MIYWVLFLSAITLGQVPRDSKPAFNLPSRKGEMTAVDLPEAKSPSRGRNKVDHLIRALGHQSDENTLAVSISRGESSGTPFIDIKSAKERFKGIKRSTLLKARINDSITAYVGSKDPVKAVVVDGEYKGATLFGSATMDKVTKNAIVAFDTFIPPHSEDTYKFLATIKDQDGNTGLVGVLESHYWETFFAEFLLSSASAAANATTQQTPTAWGNYNVVPGGDSTVRQGLAGGFNKMADKVARESQEQPEFTKVTGPVYVRVYVLEQPEKN